MKLPRSFLTDIEFINDNQCAMEWWHHLQIIITNRPFLMKLSNMFKGSGFFWDMVCILAIKVRYDTNTIGYERRHSCTTVGQSLLVWYNVTVYLIVVVQVVVARARLAEASANDVDRWAWSVYDSVLVIVTQRTAPFRLLPQFCCFRTSNENCYVSAILLLLAF